MYKKYNAINGLVFLFFFVVRSNLIFDKYHIGRFIRNTMEIKEVYF